VGIIVAFVIDGTFGWQHSNIVTFDFRDKDKYGYFVSGRWELVT